MSGAVETRTGCGIGIRRDPGLERIGEPSTSILSFRMLPSDDPRYAEVRLTPAEVLLVAQALQRHVEELGAEPDLEHVTRSLVVDEAEVTVDWRRRIAAPSFDIARGHLLSTWNKNTGKRNSDKAREGLRAALKALGIEVDDV